jgi:hypothetical protein
LRDRSDNKLGAGRRPTAPWAEPSGTPAPGCS